MLPSQDILNSLSEQMDLEPAEEVGYPKPSQENPAGGVYHASIPGGRRITLMKTLLTSACERNCYYCPFRAGRDFRRATLKPEEMAQVFIAFQRAEIAQGLFLSSGVVGGGIRTQDLLLATADILRNKYQYRGYLHLKLMPGAQRAQVERAMQLANRVSVNLEAPNTHRLQLLAPRKDFIEELLQPLRWAEEIRQTQHEHNGWQGRWPSMATQFVVGAVGESDLELLKTSEYLLRKLRLGRVYYSAFHPIQDTPLENLPAEAPLRQLRLYQASFLMRDYGFRLDELPMEADNLLQHIDPKIAWANTHLLETPLDVNYASLPELIRIPGIGPAGARSIIKYRQSGRIQQVDDLRKIGINSSRAAPYILMNGKRPAQQLHFW